MNKPNKNIKNQNGFTVIEVLLIIIVLLLVGGIGYMVYHNNHKSSNPTTSAESGKIKSSSSATKSKTTSNATSNSQNSETATIKIPEMGIEFTVPNSLSDITYNYSTNDQGTPIAGEVFADLSTTTLDDLDSGCVADSSSDAAQGTALGMLVKGTGQGSDGEDTTLLKQFSNYYIEYVNPQAGCATGPSHISEAESELNQFIKAIKSSDIMAIS